MVLKAKGKVVGLKGVKRSVKASPVSSPIRVMTPTGNVKAESAPSSPIRVTIPTFSASGLSMLLHEMGDGAENPGIPHIQMEMIADLMAQQGVRVLKTEETVDILQRCLNISAEDARRLGPAFVYRGDDTIETRELGCALAMLAEESAMERVRCMFDIYGYNNAGRMTKEEVSAWLRSLSDCCKCPMDQTALEEPTTALTLTNPNPKPNLNANSNPAL